MLIETLQQEIDPRVKAVVGEKLSLEAFAQLAGNLAGYPFIKVVVDRPKGTIHFINNARYQFHGFYIAENLLGISTEQLDREIDAFNQSVYLNADRRFYLGVLALHSPVEKGHPEKIARRFFSLETVEIDNMNAEMVKYFCQFVKDHLDPAIPLLFKPANHLQETIVNQIPPDSLPRIFSHELFSSSRFVPLNPGKAQGRLRAFKTDEDYRKAASTIEWHDILVMHRVPDDIPRVSGIINAHHTTPLSHTNVLASGWQIPNSIQIGIFEKVDQEGLDGQWVTYSVDMALSDLTLQKLDRPQDALQARPAWSVQAVKIEEPETVNTPIESLENLRMSDRYRYGTKAANLGELKHVLEQGSERLLGFYRIRRAPRPNLLAYLARLLKVPETADLPSTLPRAAWEFLRSRVQIPRGIALPFSVQQQFLESSPRIQQSIGKLKMALELNARETDSLCLALQSLIRQTRIPEKVRHSIDSHIAHHLSGVSSFVVRSSSNAEDLVGFSAAGIYESINHVSTAENVFSSIKEVWASLLSPRSVRLRQQAGISLDDSYMGVIVQEEVPSEIGGVLVTTNPMNRPDFRNVYINVSGTSVRNIVQGAELPYQYLYNTVEGGGRTLSIGDAKEDLPDSKKAVLQDLSLAGRLLQSHFSPDYTFSAPVDIEWIHNSEGLWILQLRPYGK